MSLHADEANAGLAQARPNYPARINTHGYKCRRRGAAHSSATCTGMFKNVIFCCVLLGAAAGVLGSHFRGGIIMVRPQPGGNETEV